MSAPCDDDAVGYKRPPKGSRWKKGQCGNPGRKRKHTIKGAVEIIDQLFAKRVNVVENGSTRSMSGFQLIVTQLLKKESEGDRRATPVLHKYQAFALRQSTSPDILLISEPTEAQSLENERRKIAEGDSNEEL